MIVGPGRGLLYRRDRSPLMVECWHGLGFASAPASDISMRGDQIGLLHELRCGAAGGSPILPELRSPTGPGRGGAWGRSGAAARRHPHSRDGRRTRSASTTRTAASGAAGNAASAVRGGATPTACTPPVSQYLYEPRCRGGFDRGASPDVHSCCRLRASVGHRLGVFLQRKRRRPSR
jgi:hypothetical protein